MAVHVLAVLGYKQGDRVTSTFLANSVNTNPVIIRRLLLDLQRARLVETGRGPGSGSRLSRSPARINLAEILRAVEDVEPFATPAKLPNDACPVGKGIRRTLGNVFTSAYTAMERDLERTTLANVIAGLRPSVATSGATIV